MKVEPEETSVPKSPVNEEDGDINFDLNDPEVQSAATKIQAGFRGMRTRQHLKPRQVCWMAESKVLYLFKQVMFEIWLCMN